MKEIKKDMTPEEIQAYLSEVDAKLAHVPYETMNLGRDDVAKGNPFAKLEQEVELITRLLALDVGHDVDLFAMLGVRRLEDGRYCVWREVQLADRVELYFTDPRAAAMEFVDRRVKMKLGFDHDGTLRGGS